VKHTARRCKLAQARRGKDNDRPPNTYLCSALESQCDLCACDDPWSIKTCGLHIIFLFLPDCDAWWNVVQTTSFSIRC
jgi:hypothetical protein